MMTLQDIGFCMIILAIAIKMGHNILNTPPNKKDK